MSNPWDGGPRHRTWASDTVIFGVVFLVILFITVTVDQLNGPPPPPIYLTTLLGAASAALFGAAGSDKSKREREVGDTANRAEAKADTAGAKADTLTEIARTDHPDHPELHEPPMDHEDGGP